MLDFLGNLTPVALAVCYADRNHDFGNGIPEAEAIRQALIANVGEEVAARMIANAEAFNDQLAKHIYA